MIVEVIFASYARVDTISLFEGNNNVSLVRLVDIVTTVCLSQNAYLGHIIPPHSVMHQVLVLHVLKGLSVQRLVPAVRVFVSLVLLALILMKKGELNVRLVLLGPFKIRRENRTVKSASQEHTQTPLVTHNVFVVRIVWTVWKEAKRAPSAQRTLFRREKL
jgi:hypothetical protein